MPYRCGNYVITFALSMAALYYSQLVKVKARQYKRSYTYQSKVCFENYETLRCSQKFAEDRLMPGSDAVLHMSGIKC